MDRKALETLLSRLFPKTDALRRFLRDTISDDFVNLLPGESVGHAEFCHQAAQQLIAKDRSPAVLAVLRKEHPNAKIPADPPIPTRKVRMNVVITPAAEVDPGPTLTRLRALASVQQQPPKPLVLGRDALEGELLILLMGPRHGGAEAELQALVDDERCLALAMPYNPDDIEADPGMRELRRRLHRAEDDVPSQVLNLATRWYEEHFPPRPGGNPTLHTWERRYLEDKRDPWRCGEPGALRVLLEGRAERAQWFVHLRAERPWVTRDGRVKRLRHGEVEGTGRPKEPGEKPIPSPTLDEVLGHPDRPRVAVVGGAGAGKSVLLTHIAWTLCRLHLELPEVARPDDEPPHGLDVEALTAAGPVLPIPVLATAATLVAKLRSPGGRADRPIRAGLERLLEEEIFPVVDRSELRAGLDGGRYWFLIDSLDEVPLQADRQALVTALGGLGGLRLTLSTRPMAHTDVELPQGFERLDIAPLDDDRIGRLVRALVRVSGKDAADAARAEAAILATRRDFPTDAEGRSPAENPLLLATMTLLWLKHGNLPDDRAMLYHWMIELLCERRVRAEDDDKKAEQVLYFREDLRLLALASQERYGTAMPVEAACAALTDAKRARDAGEASALLEKIVNRTGLFRFETREGARVLRPWHRSFQEYLTATQIAADYANREAACTEWLLQPRGKSGPRLSDPTWTQTLRFLVGAFGGISDERSATIVEDWLERAAKIPAREARFLALAGGGVAEYRKRLFAKRLAQVEAVRQAIHQGFAARGASWPWEDRLDALEALGRLGDPRLPDPREVEGLSVENGWVRVEGGEYAVGGDPKAPGALKAAKVRLAPFTIRVWPVTVAEFEPFTAALEDPRLWPDGRFGDRGLPRDWLDQLRRPNRPVTGVDWFTARAFCRWANGAWRLPAGSSLDLPTSREWEEAAGRGTGRVYPWDIDPGKPREPGQGDKARAAYDWGGDPFARRGAAPVGAFPDGHTPGAAIWDLAGNVWEWCASIVERGGEQDFPLLSPPDQRAVTEVTNVSAGRVLRGGSWSNNAGYLRCADRLWGRPVGRVPYIGFRVVVRVPPASAFDP